MALENTKERILGNWRTSLSAVLAVVLSQVVPALLESLAEILPVVADAIGSQPGWGWKVAGALIGILPGLLMKHAKAEPATPKAE